MPEIPALVCSANIPGDKDAPLLRFRDYPVTIAIHRNEDVPLPWPFATDEIEALLRLGVNRGTATPAETPVRFTKLGMQPVEALVRVTDARINMLRLSIQLLLRDGSGDICAATAEFPVRGVGALSKRRPA